MTECTKQARESETTEPTMVRNERNIMYKASTTECETTEQTVVRKDQNRVHMASIRKSEKPQEMFRRKHSNKEAMVNKKNSNVSIEHAILSFNSDIKDGSNFVCTCCH